jgi:hypothetical protein
MRIVPRGYITAREAWDRIGRERHKDWTGSIEHTARQNLTTIEQYEIDCNTPGTGNSGGGAGRNWFKYTPEMLAERMAKTRAEIYSDAYQAERVARVRYEDVFSEFLRRLECGDIRAVALSPGDGKLRAVASEVWRTNRAQYYLTHSLGPTGFYYRNRQQVVREGELFIEEVSIRPTLNPDRPPMISAHDLYSMIMQVASKTKTEQDVKTAVMDQCAGLNRRFPEAMWRENWKKVPPDRKRMPGETNKTIKNKTGR